jgi:methanogenic corrinoid protein MtbC1
VSTLPTLASGLNIAALSKRTGVAPDTLRKWEQRYGILRPTRTDGGQRRYSEHDVDRVLWLQARLSEGFRIGEAAGLLGCDAPATASSPEQLVRLVLEAATCCDASAVNRLLDHALALEFAIACREVLQPLLFAVGDAWQDGQFSVAQEHLVSGAVRARLERRLTESRAPVHGRAVLACAPGEQHELGLLMLAVMLRAEGWDVAYLGPDSPVACSVAMARDSGARLVCFSIGSDAAAEALADGLREARLADEIELVIGGRAASPQLAARIGAGFLAEDLDGVVASLRLPLRAVVSAA